MPVSKRRAGVKSKQARRAKTTMPSNDKIKSISATKEIKIKNVFPTDVPLHFSDNLLVQHRAGMFYLYFMQHQYPIILEPEDLQTIDNIKSMCVAKVNITPIQMAKNIDALERNFRQLLKVMNSEAKDYKEFLDGLEEDPDLV